MMLNPEPRNVNLIRPVVPTAGRRAFTACRRCRHPYLAHGSLGCDLCSCAGWVPSGRLDRLRHRLADWVLP